MERFVFKTPVWELAAISAICGMTAAMAFYIMKFHPVMIALGGIVSFAVIFFLLKITDDINCPTLTYLSEEDVEKIRACLIKQEDNDAKEGVNNE